jgi:hypothetical protein
MSADIATAVPLYFYWFGPDSFVALTLGAQDVNLQNATLVKSGVYKVVAEVQNTGCRSDTAYINAVVNANLIPNVFITADDTTITGPMVPIIFTANVTNAGTSPTYQWTKNSLNIPGATGQTYTGINGFDFQHQDTIGVKVSADASNPCPQTTLSNRLIVRINLGVDDVAGSGNAVLYPNPNNGQFALSGLPANKTIEIAVVNTIGQTVYSETVQQNGGTMQVNPGEIPGGIYLLQVKTEDTVQSIRFTKLK